MFFISFGCNSKDTPLSDSKTADQLDSKITPPSDTKTADQLDSKTIPPSDTKTADQLDSKTTPPSDTKTADQLDSKTTPPSDTKTTDQPIKAISPVKLETYKGYERSSLWTCEVSIPENAVQKNNYKALFSIYSEDDFLIHVNLTEKEVVRSTEDDKTVQFFSDPSTTFVYLDHDKNTGDLKSFHFSQRMKGSISSSDFICDFS